MARTFPKDIHGMVSWVPNTLNAKLPGATPYMSHIDMGGRSQIPCLSFGRGLTHVPVFSGRLGKWCLHRTDVTGNLTFLSEGT